MSTTRDRILSCACDLFVEAGAEGFTVRELARRVGVTAPALYRYFEGRDELLAEVVDEAYRLLRDYLYRALEGGDPRERFRRAGEAYLDFALDHPGFYHALYAATEVPAPPRGEDGPGTHACAVGQFWMDRVRECMDAGALEENDPEAVSLTLWAHAHGLVCLYIMGMLDEDEESFRELYGASNRRILRGLAGPDGRRSAAGGSAADAAGGAAAGPGPPRERTPAPAGSGGEEDDSEGHGAEA